MPSRRRWPASRSNRVPRGAELYILELLRLFWPELTATDLDRNRQSDDLAENVASIISSLSERHGLPAEATKLAIRCVIQSPMDPQHRVLDLIRGCFDVKTIEHGPLGESADAAQHALAMIARVWTMLDIQVAPSRYRPFEPLTWLDNEGITDVTERFFLHRTEAQRASSLTGTIDPDLTAARLVRNHGFRILWTSNLAEHLTVNWTAKRRRLKVFEHKVWAYQHLTHPESSPIPSDVLQELMWTYNLLFPMFNRKTKSLLKEDNMVRSFYGLGTCGKVASRNWMDYSYWRTELYNLTQVLDEPPQGVQQLWRTRRKDPNVLNIVLFWVSGVTVAILTVIASVSGLLSVRYAIESKNIALEQLEVERAQSCPNNALMEKLISCCQPGVDK